ncbi:hypothetical protein L6452_36257 [Arctium lappa]|uniref:Uncharacterized protein n=1 Tax=Arctium lappa TaxID=4217 RepID=A0ACB8Y8R3_ARCLA|nr:hypothetical protein L6452_36257 [Arctium lappa]
MWRTIPREKDDETGKERLHGSSHSIDIMSGFISGERAAVRALSGNDRNLVQCRKGDNVLRSGDLRGDGYGNPPQMEPLFPAGIEVSRAGEGDAFLVLVVLDKKKGNNLFLLFAFLSHDD